MAQQEIIRECETYIQTWTVKPEYKQELIDRIEAAVRYFNQSPTSSNPDCVKQMRQLEDAIALEQLTADNIDDYMDIFFPELVGDDFVNLTLYDDGDEKLALSQPFELFDFSETTIEIPLIHPSWGQ